MASDADLQSLDALGPVLCRLGHQRVTLSWQGDVGGPGYYFVDGRDEAGNFFSGMGATPSAALAAGMRNITVAASGGIHVDA